VIASLRRLRMTGAEIAESLGMPVSTVSGILTRIGLGKLWRLEPPQLANRYERSRLGELVHVDVKKLDRIGRPGHRVNGDRRTQSRGIGWEYVHVAIDDVTRLVYVEVLDDEKARWWEHGLPTSTARMPGCGADSFAPDVCERGPARCVGLPIGSIVGRVV